MLELNTQLLGVRRTLPAIVEDAPLMLKIMTNKTSQFLGAADPPQQ